MNRSQNFRTKNTLIYLNKPEKKNTKRYCFRSKLSMPHKVLNGTNIQPQSINGVYCGNDYDLGYNKDKLIQQNVKSAKNSKNISKDNIPYIWIDDQNATLKTKSQSQTNIWKINTFKRAQHPTQIQGHAKQYRKQQGHKGLSLQQQNNKLRQENIHLQQRMHQLQQTHIKQIEMLNKKIKQLTQSTQMIQKQMQRDHEQWQKQMHDRTNPNNYFKFNS